MDLIDDIDAVSAHLRRYADLIHQGLYVLDTIVGCGVKFMDAVRTALCKGLAGFTCSARLHIPGRVGAVYHLREDTCRRGLSHSARSAEEICMCELPSQDRVLEGLRYVVLTDKRPEGVRPVFSC